MEFFILIVIIVIICLILNVSMNIIVGGIVILLSVISALFTLAFLGCTICLLRSQKKEAHFVRMGTPSKGKLQVAYYSVDDMEYPCVFPKEIMLEEKLYKKDVAYTVRLNKRWNRVFDRFAVTTCFIGLIAGIVVSSGMLLYFLL